MLNQYCIAGINRIRLEFKVASAAFTWASAVVLIESDWNLKEIVQAHDEGIIQY